MKLVERFKLIQSMTIICVLSQWGAMGEAYANLYVNKKTPIAYEEVKLAIGSDKLTKWARSNAPQSWAWFKSFADQYLPRDILAYEGQIDGDPHNGNYGPLLVNGKVQWRLLDYDDAGWGPFILDYAKFLIATKAVDSVQKIKAKDIWQQYLLGLSGKAYKNTPMLIQEMLVMSATEFRLLEIKKAMKFSSANRLLNDGERSSKISDSKLERQVFQAFRESLPEGLTVLDVGGREKIGGGSGAVNGQGGAMRFVALVKGRDGRNTLYELKQHLGSGVAMYQTQNLSVQQILDFNVLGSASRDRNFRQVNVNIGGDKVFVLRPKPQYFYEYANKAKTHSQLAEFQALTMYNAWYKGYMHGKQPAAKAYIKALAEDKEGRIAEGLKDLTWGYLEYLESFLPD